MSEELLRAYKASWEMEPIVQVDYYVQIRTYSEPLGFFRKVNYYEKIPPFQLIDIGAIAAQTMGNKTNCPNWDVWDEEFGQWRWMPMDNAQISFFLPSGVSKWQLKNITVAIDKSIVYRDPLLVSTEFCKWEDQAAALQPMNFSDYALTACRIITFGYRFHTEKVSDEVSTRLSSGKLPFTPIICAGMGGAGR